MALFINIKRQPSRERHITKRLIIFFLCGLGLSFMCVVFLLLCQMPCPENTNSFDYTNWKRSMGFMAQSQSSRYTLVILVISGPNNVQARHTIRQTWAKSLDESQVLLRYVVGTAALEIDTDVQLVSENALYRDMILLNNVKDSYKELTFKVLQAFIFIDKHIDYQYVLKVDDDSFVMVHRVLSELQFKSKERLYWGFFDGRANVKTSGKWMEKNWILCDKYLPYARGGGYVLSFDLVNFIARNSDLLQLFLSEDVSVGTWLAALKVNRHHDVNFDTEYLSRGCLNSYLVMHKQSALNMQKLNDNLKTAGVLCRPETILRGSYEYNWNYPPSQCCNRTRVKYRVDKRGQLI